MRDPRTVVGHLFSRGVLGSMLVGTAAGKVVEKVVIIAFPASPFARLVGWLAAMLVFVGLYVYWADIESYASDAADAAADSVQGDDDA